MTFSDVLQAWIAATIDRYPYPDLSDKAIRQFADAMCPDVAQVPVDDTTYNLVFPDGSSVSFAYDGVIMP